jgi:alpha-L-arabinofuranosidase
MERRRRQFLKQAALGGSGLLLLRGASPARAATSARIEVLPGEPIGSISPNLHGHFTEHIGGVVSESDIHAHNSFEHPSAVVPRAIEPVAAAGRLVCLFPPASVVRVTADLA